MGQLFLVHESFELAHVPVPAREQTLKAYCSMVEHATRDHDSFFTDSDFYIHQYSYGNIFQSFIYASWDRIKQDPLYEGISQTLHNLLCQSFNHKCQIKDLQLFEQSPGHKGYSGFDFCPEPLHEPYIKCEQSWFRWKITWYASHPDEINWQDDKYLPNKQYSNGILRAELEKENIICDRTQIMELFYERIMKHKAAGGPREAYIREIGRKICEANFYIFDEVVSKKNRKEGKDEVLRDIFSIQGPSGRKQYISLDFEKGMFEYHDYCGRHMGEYRFNGSFNKKAEASHNILI